MERQMNQHSPLRFVFLAVGLAISLVQTNASAGQRYIPLQERAQGQSLTGAQLLNDSMFSNPASASLSEVYAVDGSAQSLNSFSISVLDTRTSAIGGALGYFRMPSVNSDKPDQGGVLGLSGRLANWLGVGVAGRMLWMQTPAGGTEQITDFNVGLLANLGVLEIGATVQNVGGGRPELGVDRFSQVGARVNYERTLFLSGSVESVSNGVDPAVIGVGAEYVSPYHFSLKGGYRHGLTDAVRQWSAGVSILSPKLSLHYAVLFPYTLRETAEHSIGATVQF